MVLAAGASTRYGRLKQLEPVGPSGETLMDYGVYDAARAGCSRVVFVVRDAFHDAVRAHARRYAGAIDVDLAVQDVTLPPPHRTPPDRRTPWGTGHAVLAAAGVVDTECLVVNADDFYGEGSYRALAAHLRRGTGVHAMVGYRLDDTLSPTGGVSRALCAVTAEGRLRGLEELFDVAARDAGIAGRGRDGRCRRLDGGETVSMNIWGFHPSVFDGLARRFRQFLDRLGEDPRGEFLLSTAVNDLVAGGEAAVQVLPASDAWFGMTFADDRAAAEHRLAALVEAGAYPRHLFPG